MQFIDFGDDKESIAKLINDLVIKNIISRELSALIDIEEIYCASQTMQHLSKNAKAIYKEKNNLFF